MSTCEACMSGFEFEPSDRPSIKSLYTYIFPKYWLVPGICKQVLIIVVFYFCFIVRSVYTKFVFTCFRTSSHTQHYLSCLIYTDYHNISSFKRVQNVLLSVLLIFSYDYGLSWLCETLNKPVLFSAPIVYVWVRG